MPNMRLLELILAFDLLLFHGSKAFLYKKVYKFL